MKRRYFLLVLILIVSGCISGPIRPVLEYSLGSLSLGKNNIVIKVDKITDERTWSKERIGEVNNIYGMTLTDIIPQGSITDWVTDALKQELINAGYTLSNEASVVNVIGGSVLEVYTEARYNLGCIIRLDILLKKDGKDVFRKEYTAKIKRDPSWAAKPGSFNKILEITLQEVMKQAIPDINKILLDSKDTVKK